MMYIADDQESFARVRHHHHSHHRQDRIRQQEDRNLHYIEHMSRSAQEQKEEREGGSNNTRREARARKSSSPQIQFPPTPPASPCVVAVEGEGGCGEEGVRGKRRKGKSGPANGTEGNGSLGSSILTWRGRALGDCHSKEARATDPDCESIDEGTIRKLNIVKGRQKEDLSGWHVQLGVMDRGEKDRLSRTNYQGLLPSPASTASHSEIGEGDFGSSSLEGDDQDGDEEWGSTCHQSPVEIDLNPSTPPPLEKSSHDQRQHHTINDTLHSAPHSPARAESSSIDSTSLPPTMPPKARDTLPPPPPPKNAGSKSPAAVPGLVAHINDYASQSIEIPELEDLVTVPNGTKMKGFVGEGSANVVIEILLPWGTPEATAQFFRGRHASQNTEAKT